MCHKMTEICQKCTTGVIPDLIRNLLITTKCHSGPDPESINYNKCHSRPDPESINYNKCHSEPAPKSINYKPRRNFFTSAIR